MAGAVGNVPITWQRGDTPNEIIARNPGLRLETLQKVVPFSDPAAGLPDRGSVRLVRSADRRELVLPEVDVRLGSGKPSAVEKQAVELAWRELQKGRQIALGPLELQPDIDTVSDDPIKGIPEWKAFSDAAAEDGKTVYWVSFSAKLDPSFDTGWVVPGGTDEASIDGQLTFRMTVPVVVNGPKIQRANELGRVLKRAISKTLDNFPYNLERASRMRGPWQMVVGGQLRIGTGKTDLYGEVVTDIRRGPGSGPLTAAAARQFLPRAGFDGSKAFDDGDVLKVKLSGGSDIQLHRVETEVYQIEVSPQTVRSGSAASDAFTHLVTLRTSGLVGTGVSRSKGTRDTWVTQSDKMSINVAYGDHLSLGVLAKHERLQYNPPWSSHPWISGDTVRKAQVEKNNSVYHRFSFKAAPKIGGSMNLSQGAVSVKVGASTQSGTLREVVVERPRSLLEGGLGVTEALVDFPDSLDDHRGRSPGNVYKEMTFGVTKAYAQLTAGVNKTLGPASVEAGVTAGTSLQRENVLELTTYELPGNKVYVDLKQYNLKKHLASLKLEASVELFARADAEELLAKYFDNELADRAANELVERHLHELEIAAEHIRTLSGRRYAASFETVLSLDNPEHAAIYDLIRKGNDTEAYRRIDKLVDDGRDVAYAWVRPGDEEGTSWVNVGDGTRRFAEKTIIDEEDNSRIGLTIGGHELNLLKVKRLAEDHIQRGGRITRNQDGSLEIWSGKARDSEYRYELGFLGSSDKIEVHSVTYKERLQTAADPNARWKELDAFVKIRHKGNERISGKDFEDAVRFARSIGMEPRFSKEPKSGNFLEVLFGNRYGRGDMALEFWIAKDGLDLLTSKAEKGEADLWAAAGLVADVYDGKADGSVPAWATNPEARAVVEQWRHEKLTEFSGEDSRLGDFEREYERLTGRTFRDDYKENDYSETYDAAKKVAAGFKQVLEGLKQRGMRRTMWHEGWNEIGEALASDYRVAAIIGRMLVPEGESEDLLNLERFAMKAERAAFDVPSEGRAPTLEMSQLQQAMARQFVTVDGQRIVY